MVVAETRGTASQDETSHGALQRRPQGEVMVDDEALDEIHGDLSTPKLSSRRHLKRGGNEGSGGF